MPESTSRAAVFDLCPTVLLSVAIVLGIAEADSFLHGHTAPHKAVSVTTLFLSLAIFGLPFALAVRPRSARDWFDVLTACLILPAGNAIMPWAMEETVRALPTIYDTHVIPLDGALGFQPSFAVGALFVRYPAFAAICGAIYGAVLFPTALVAAMEGLLGRRRGVGALPTFMAIAGIGFALYHWLPAIGPAAWFGPSFPFETEFAHPPFPRNAIPSLHTAGVVMAFLTTRGMSLPIRLTVGAMAAGTIVATLGSGAHYLTDLILACPFVLTIRGLCATDLPAMARARVGACLVGIGLLAAWGLAVRGVVDAAAIAGAVPTAMAATVVVSLWWESRLARAETAATVR